MSLGLSGDKHVINFFNTRTRGRVCLLLTTENEKIFILKTTMVNYGWNKQSRPRFLALAILTCCFPPETPRNIAFIPSILKRLKLRLLILQLEGKSVKLHWSV